MGGRNSMNTDCARLCWGGRRRPVIASSESGSGGRHGKGGGARVEARLVRVRLSCEVGDSRLTLPCLTLGIKSS